VVPEPLALVQVILAEPPVSTTLPLLVALMVVLAGETDQVAAEAGVAAKPSAEAAAIAPTTIPA
jgi:hypothetical protein